MNISKPFWMVNMKKLFQLLGKNKPIAGLLGIEIEAEGKDMREVITKYWRSENDGSLRGHYPETKAEFVLHKPIELNEVVPALEELTKALKGATFDFSFRTSVHVHVNVQDLTHAQIMNMVYTYLLIEEPLMTYCGKSRKANRFCLRAADAEGLLTTINKMIREGEGSHYLADDNIRYSAINLAALNKYGSIEFRGMRGNMDIEVISTWATALTNLKAFAAAQESPVEIQKLMEKVGTKAFLSAVVGPELAKVFTYPRIQKDMARSYSISLDLPYNYTRFKPVPIVPGQIVRKWVDKGHEIDAVRRMPPGTEMVYGGNWYVVVKGQEFESKGRYKGPSEAEWKAAHDAFAGFEIVA